MSEWILHVQNFAKTHNIKYNEAMKNSACKSSYNIKIGGSIKSIATKSLYNGTIIDPMSYVNSTKVTGQVIQRGDLKIQNSMMPPILKQYLDKYNNSIIVGATIYKHSINSMITGILNTISYTESNFETLFHLRIYLKLDNGTDIFLEKNERINCGVNDKQSNSQNMIIENIDLPKGLTFGNLIENTKNYMGNKFYPYSAKNNNCQYFIIGILNANHFGNINKYSNFTKQATEDYFTNRNGLRQVANTVTDLAGTADTIVNGGNILKGKSKIDKLILAELIKMK